MRAAIGKLCTDSNDETVTVHGERRELARSSELGNVGWHTFRHTYRSWLDDAGAPIGVQQKLMRHAGIATTAKYGDVLRSAKWSRGQDLNLRPLGYEFVTAFCR